MKRLTELRPCDLDTAAVWRYDGEIDDTATVRATDRTDLREDESQTYIARTQFVLGNGAQFIGFCSPCDEEELVYVQPVIVTNAGPVFFFFEEPPSAEFLRAQWQRLGVGHEEIFPVHFRCTVPVDGHFVTGVVHGDDVTGAA